MYNVVLYCIKRIHYFLSIIGLRSQHHWGVVYDAKTKQPVDPVVVKLLDANTGEVIASSIANMNGEYGFMAQPGLYKIFAQRANYIFPSRRVPGPHDGIYRNIYTGQLIEFNGGSDVISLNIPLDPVRDDWNQQDKLKVVKVHPGLERFWFACVRLIFWAALFGSSTTFYFTKDQRWLYGTGVLIFIVLIARLLPEVRLWGRVRNRATGQPLPNVTITLSHKKLPDVTIAKAVTTSEGKFFIRLAKGEYAVHIHKPNSPTVVIREITIGPEGLVNNEWKV